jgi:hypothetical protein
MIAARGFAVSSQDDNLRSTEQDILLVDTAQEAPLFYQGGLVIAFPRTVKAAVSVKTTLDSSTVADSVAGLNVLRNVCKDETEPSTIWCGAYFFEVAEAVAKNPSLVVGHVRTAMTAKPVARPVKPADHPPPCGPDMLCSARSLAFRTKHGYAGDSETTVAPRLVGYECGELATAFFLASLLDHLARCRGFSDSDFSRFADVAEFAPVVGPVDLPPV